MKKTPVLSTIIDIVSRSGKLDPPILLSGSLAVQHYLPPEQRSEIHDDIDFIVPGWNPEIRKDEYFRRLQRAFPEFSNPKNLGKEQPRRTVWEIRGTANNSTVTSHIEFTDIPVRSIRARVNIGRNGKRVVANVPEVNYLVARLLFGIGSVTRPWHRKIDDARNCAHLLRAVSPKQVSVKRIKKMLRKLSAGESRYEAVRVGIHQTLSELTPEAITTRAQGMERKDSKRNGVTEIELKKLRQTFGQAGKKPILSITLSRRIREMDKASKKAAYVALGVQGPQSDTGLWKAVMATFNLEDDRVISDLIRRSDQGIVELFNKIKPKKRKVETTKKGNIPTARKSKTRIPRKRKSRKQRVVKKRFKRRIQMGK